MAPLYVEFLVAWDDQTPKERTRAHRREILRKNALAAQVQ